MLQTIPHIDMDDSRSWVAVMGIEHQRYSVKRVSNAIQDSMICVVFARYNLTHVRG
jgi:hypothetical protein